MMTIEEFRTIYGNQIKMREKEKENYIVRKTEQNFRDWLTDIFVPKRGYDKDIERCEQEIEDLKNRLMAVHLEYKIEGNTEYRRDGNSLREYRTEPREFELKIIMKAEAVYYMIPPKYMGLEPCSIGVAHAIGSELTKRGKIHDKNKKR